MMNKCGGSCSFFGIYKKMLLQLIFLLSPTLAIQFYPIDNSGCYATQEDANAIICFDGDQPILCPPVCFVFLSFQSHFFKLQFCQPTICQLSECPAPIPVCVYFL
jgi:hypothetical protein